MAPESIWMSANFEEGDFVLFNNKTVHGSFVNKMDSFRVSVDTRWVTKPDFDLINFNH